MDVQYDHFLQRSVSTFMPQMPEETCLNFLDLLLRCGWCTSHELLH